MALEISYKFVNNDGIRPHENFDAIIWTSAKQNTLTAEGIQPRQQALRTLDDIYTTISIVLRSEDITRARPEEQNELVRRALSQQRTLLIVDNLETVDDEAVMTFLRELPAPTKAVVTTRHRVDVAYPIRLLDMSWSDAKTLIEQECEKKGVLLNNIELQTLYERTRGVPIAIVWSIGQMGLGYSISNILVRLERPDSEIAHFCFDESVKLIRNRPAHKVLMSLSLFAFGANRNDLGYTADLQEFDRDEALVTVERLSLVNKQGDKFSMLPLAKIYSLQELEKNLEFAYSATNRRIEQLLGLVRQTERQYWIQDQQTIMEEGENFLALFEWFVAHNKSKPALNIIKFAVLHLQYAGRRAEALNLARYGIQLANEHNSKPISSWLFVDAGWILSQQGSHAEAIMSIKEALANYQLMEDEIGVCFANCFLAQALRHAGETITGEELLVSVSKRASQLDYTEGTAIAEFEFGKLARKKKDWQSAYEHLAIAYSALQTMGNSPDIFSLAIQGNYGTAALRLGKYGEARDITEGVLKHLEVWRKFGLASNFTARMYLQKAEIEIEENDFDKAIEYSQKALDLAKSTKNEKGVAQANRILERLN